MSSDVLLGVAAFDADQQEKLEAVVAFGGESFPAEMRWMAPTSLASNGLKVFTISVPRSVDGDIPKTLEVRRPGGGRVLGPVGLGSSDIMKEDPPKVLSLLNPDIREKVVEFVSTARSGHLGRRGDVALSKNLFAFREALREQLPSLTPDKDQPQGGCVELLVRVDDTSFYMQGWVQDREAHITRMTAVAPEGDRVELLERVSWHSRADVEDFYGPAPDGSVSKPGFVAYFETQARSCLSAGWVVEIENEARRTGEMPAPSVLEELVTAPKRILGWLPLHALPDEDLMSSHVSPAITKLQERYRGLGNSVEAVEYGDRPHSPETSIVIPLYKRIDFLEHQLAQFTRDPEVKACEVIYVLDSPELGRQLCDMAAQLYPLYGVPLTVLKLERSCGFAGATNFGVAEARGRLLLLLNSDILPDKPGWIGEMAAFYDSEKKIGALGPKLLYEDDSLQHAGMYFHLPKDTALADIWANVHYFKGLNRELPAANVVKRVPAVTGACMMVAKALYEQVGGFPEVYVQGDHEDSDFCLRLLEAGYENWYIPKPELYHLEGQSYPGPERGRMALYNRWLHAKRWGQLVEELMPEYPPGAATDFIPPYVEEDAADMPADHPDAPGVARPAGSRVVPLEGLRKVNP